MSHHRTFSQIREEFFAFFREKQHEIVPSAPIVPRDDPTLLFINAGMNQFKDVFLGEGEREYRRAADSQKCLRVSGKHNDLEEVGHDTYHHTFFEMLGNWSFGDYFKKEAIAWAWELFTERWGLDPDRLYATVHAGDEALGLEEDTEAAAFWEQYVLPGHLLKYSSRYNFWMMGDTGPCGPCSEIHIDLRSDEERLRVPGSTLVNQDDPRLIELWNLVFIQYNAMGDGTLVALADNHVDTGMGLERLVAVLQGKSSNYDTDLFSPLLQRIADLSPLEALRGYDDIRDTDRRDALRIAMRVIADHIRAIAFAICDGAAPGNVGRAYVIRRILRRAARYGYQVLELRDPFLYRLVAPLVELMGEQFPELKEGQDTIARIIQAEEKSFLHTLGKGMSLFERVLPYLRELSTSANGRAGQITSRLASDMRTMNLLQMAYGVADDPAASLEQFVTSARKQEVPGELAFLLHDTYGFPIDLTQLMAREEGFGVNIGRYEELMAEQRGRGRGAAPQPIYLSERVVLPAPTISANLTVERQPPSEFVGYETTSVEDAKITIVRKEEPYFIVLDKTPFYVESGGQVGDTGFLQVADEQFRVTKTEKRNGQIFHYVDKRPTDACAIGEQASAFVDTERRARTTKHHTATHLFHAALREILGSHVAQKGSLVAPDHLRFDFSHYERVSPEQIQHIQDRVNSVVQQNIQAHIDVDVPIKDALARGAMALFGEKYSDKVRVVTFDPTYSVELCGGTHVGATGEIGLFLVRSEGSVAAGIRRVEAIVGVDALTMVQHEFEELGRIRGHIRESGRASDKVVADLVLQARRLEKEVERLRVVELAASLESVIGQAQLVNGVCLATGRLASTSMDTLRTLGVTLRQRLGAGSVGVLGTADLTTGKAYLVATVSEDLVRQGLQAGTFVGQLARLIGGGGGGRPDLATAGGRRPEYLDKAIAAAASLLADMLVSIPSTS